MGHEERIALRDQGLGAGGDDIDARHLKSADDLAEEGGFFVVGFDHRELDFGRPDFRGQSGEAGAGAEVDDSGQWLVASGW